MVTDKVAGESSGRHLHSATKVCPRDQMARSPDQHSSVWQHSASIRETSSANRLKFVGHCARMSSYAPQPVCQLLMWEPKAKGRRGMGAKQTYPDIILRDCGMH